MLDYLDKLRRKPRHVRVQIAYTSTAVIFLIILSVWWKSWNIRPDPKYTDVISEKSPISVVLDTFTGVKEQTLTSWQDTVENIQKLATSSQNIAAIGGVDQSDGTSTPESTSTDALIPNTSNE